MTTAVVLLGVLVVLTLTRSGDATAQGDDGIQQPGSPFTGSRGVGAPAPAFALRDQDGKPASIRALRGKPAVVTFMYSTCEDTCPAIAAQIATGLEELGRNVPTMLISVDPKNDTPENAQRFLNKNRLRGRAQFVLGTQRQLAPIWRAYSILPQGQGFEHSATVFLLDAQGRQRVSFPADKFTAEGLAHDLRVLLAEDASPAR
jgi:protein SCO1/2